MSQGQLDVLRGVYDRWADGDFRAGSDLWDEQSVFIQRPEFPDAGTYLGPEGVARYMRGFLESWTKITIAADELIEAGDSVIVAVTQVGTGLESGAVTELRYFHVWTFRGPKVIRWEGFRTRDEALAAVGLSE